MEDHWDSYKAEASKEMYIQLVLRIKDVFLKPEHELCHIQLETVRRDASFDC